MITGEEETVDLLPLFDLRRGGLLAGAKDLLRRLVKTPVPGVLSFQQTARLGALVVAALGLGLECFVTAETKVFRQRMSP